MRWGTSRAWRTLGWLALLAGVPSMAQAAAPVIAVRLVMTDVQGTPVMKKDLQGHILARYDYRPYGAQQSGPVQAEPGYTGHVNDPQTGLVYIQDFMVKYRCDLFCVCGSYAPYLGFATSACAVSTSVRPKFLRRSYPAVTLFALFVYILIEFRRRHQYIDRGAQRWAHGGFSFDVRCWNEFSS